MRYALTAAESRAAEEAAVSAGVPLRALMECAGAAVAAEVSAIAPDGAVVVLAGSGNNGGDGWVAARLMRDAGRDVRLLSVAEPGGLPEPAREAAADALAAGVPFVVAAGRDDAEDALEGAAALVDALLGTGASGPARPPCDALIEAAAGFGGLRVSVDVPSGVDADTGAAVGPAIAADVTVALGSLKRAHVLHPGAGLAGEVVLADIGIPEAAPGPGALEVWDAGEYADLLPWPSAADHKGSRGRVVIAGGAPGMTGAVALAASAALRAGAGYVTTAIPAPSLPVVETLVVEAVKAPLPWDAEGAAEGFAGALLGLLGRADALVLGNGAGRHPATLAALLDVVRRAPVPLVIDGDGLEALAADPDILRVRTAPTVITPHAGEAARLLGATVADVLADRVAAARELSSGDVTCVLKGAGTLVARGTRTIVNMTGNPGMATLGTGDVLAGIMGTLLAQGLDALDAAALAAFLHGAAGDLAADDLTPVSCVAGDLIDHLPDVIRELRDAAAPL